MQSVTFADVALHVNNDVYRFTPLWVLLFTLESGGISQTHAERIKTI